MIASRLAVEVRGMWLFLRSITCAALALILSSAPSPGEECRDREQPTPAYSTEGGLRVAVIRAGVMKQDNPLRPLSTQPLTIWQVAVNGKPGFLRHAAPGVLQELQSVAELEYVNSTSIAWSNPPANAPSEIRILTTKGSTVGPLRFAGCEQRSKIPTPKSAESSAPGKERASVRLPPAPSVRLPQGAIAD
jgi:hypothetical protein